MLLAELMDKLATVIGGLKQYDAEYTYRLINPILDSMIEVLYTHLYNLKFTYRYNLTLDKFNCYLSVEHYSEAIKKI